MRRFHRVIMTVAVLIASGLLAPTAGWTEAPWSVFDSSMSVACVPGAIGPCSALRFALELAGESTLHFVQITNQSPELFSFSRVTSIQDRSGNELAWSTGGPWRDTGLAIEIVDASGKAADNPIYMTVGLNSGSADALPKASFEYYAKGYQGSAGAEPFETSGMTATPEPASLALLGSGLVSLVGMGRMGRRRRRAMPEELGDEVSPEG